VVQPPVYARWDDLRGWEYASLEEVSADHFASDTFRGRHDFVVLDSSSSGTVIGYCPRSSREPAIRGEIVVASDSSLSGARWEFLVPHDGDDAGGEASFTVGHFLGARYLIANRGSTWRQNGGRKRYALTSFELDNWRIGRTREGVSTGWIPRGDMNSPPQHR
jgi:hypothetical protein